MPEEKKEFWKTFPLIFEETTLEKLMEHSQDKEWNNGDRFVFSVQWQFLPDKFQTGDKPKVAGIVWVKEKPKQRAPDPMKDKTIQLVRKGL